MYLTETNIVYVPDIKEEIMDYEKIVQSLDLENENENIYEAVPLNGTRKRMRSNQLTWEEKIQRKKLRNRIAAQTSRDRKKAKMDYLEETVKDLKQQNELLYLEVEELRKKNEMLIDANAELQKALTSRPYTCSCLTNKTSERKEISTNSREVEAEGTMDSFGTGTDKDNFLECLENFSSLPLVTEMLADVKGDTFLDDLERLAASLLEEVEQHERKRDTESVLSQVPGPCKEECSSNFEVVGSTSKVMESSRSKIKDDLDKHHQHCFQSPDLTVEEKIWLITSEHSYAYPQKLQLIEEFQTLNFNNTNQHSNTVDCKNIPQITITESEKISIIEDELKKDTLDSDLSQFTNTLDIPSISSFHSPRSEASSDQGYESLDSPYGSEISRNESLSEFWGDSLSELFPELM